MGAASTAKVIRTGKPLRLGEGYAGRAAVERCTIHISNLTAQEDNPRLARAMAKEAFVSYYGVPLIAKGNIKGVLEVFHRVRLEPDEEWLDFLDTLAGQAAIAVDNATLFENLQRSNTDLMLAYDTTLEGWSAALDLRDKETEAIHDDGCAHLLVRLVLLTMARSAAMAPSSWWIVDGSSLARKIRSSLAPRLRMASS